MRSFFRGSLVCNTPWGFEPPLSCSLAHWWQTLLPLKRVARRSVIGVSCCQTSVRWHGFVAATRRLKNSGNFWRSGEKAEQLLSFLGPLKFSQTFLECENMQKLNSGTHDNMLPRDAELQMRLADSGGAAEGKENGAGKQFLTRPEEERSFCTKRKMLVVLDLICLLVGRSTPFMCVIYNPNCYSSVAQIMSNIEMPPQ